jgi:hypothetical protein
MSDLKKLMSLFEAEQEKEKERQAAQKLACFEMLEKISPITIAKYKKLVDIENDLIKEMRKVHRQTTDAWFALQSDEFKKACNDIVCTFSFNPEQGILNEWLESKGITRER